MQRLKFCVLILLYLSIQNTFAQQVDKVIISGYGGQHDLDVKNAFLLGYASHDNSQFTGEILLHTSTLQSSFEYATANDFELIVRSTSGLATGYRLAPDYPTVDLVMPSGSNSYTQSFYGDVLASPVVITGAGTDSNQTSYKLEFFSEDPITENNLSSYANGYVAGQLSFIANTLNCSLDSARILARESGSQNGVFSTYNGFGKIIPGNILTGELPVELTSFSADILGKNILLKWKTANETNNFGFDVERTSPIPPPYEGGGGVAGGGWEKIGFVSGNGNSNSPKYYSFTDENPGNHNEFYYRLKQFDTDGKFEYSDIVNVQSYSNGFELNQNYPNPFNPSTKISFTVADAYYASPVWVTLRVFDVLGNEIATLVDESKESGTYEIEFDASSLPSGVYIYKLTAGNFTSSRKLIILK